MDSVAGWVLPLAVGASMAHAADLRGADPKLWMQEEEDKEWMSQTGEQSIVVADTKDSIPLREEEDESIAGVVDHPFEKIDSKVDHLPKGSAVTWERRRNRHNHRQLGDPPLPVQVETSSSTKDTKGPKGGGRCSTKGPKSTKGPSSSKQPKNSSSSSKAPKSSFIVCEDEEDPPSMMECTNPNLTVANPRCFSGNASEVTQQCADNNANCCTGSKACYYWINGTVCENSCNGAGACYYTSNGYFSTGSCNGDYACYDIGRYQKDPSRTSSAVIGKGSCNCFYACLSVGDLSEYENAVIIGDYSCNADKACYYVGVYTNDPAVIGDNACNAPMACARFAYNVTVGNVSIGDNACNVDSQCSGSYNESGSLVCFNADGSYGPNLPDNAVGCTAP